MYVNEGGVPDDDYVIPFGVADVKREGEDATVVAIGGNGAAGAGGGRRAGGRGLGHRGGGSEDPLAARRRHHLRSRCARPVGRWCARWTRRLPAAARRLPRRWPRQCFHDLRAPIVRVGSPHVPMPFAEELVNLTVPDADSICAAVRRVMG